MSTFSIPLTHRGWFGVCPIYLTDPDAGEPVLEPRHWAAEPLFWLSEAVYDVVFWCCEAMNPGFEAAWPLLITGEAPAGTILEYEA